MQSVCDRVSEQNGLFLALVYANALSDTLGVIIGSMLSPEEKLEELKKISAHPITIGVFRWSAPEIDRCKANLLNATLGSGSVIKETTEDLRFILQTLSIDKPLLYGIADTAFPQQYPNIYLSIWQGQYDQALDKMTGLLLEGRGADETFLRLYLSLAAAQEQVPAFVFGKVRMAQLLLRQGKKTECQPILNELAEMGVEDNNEILELRRKLEI